MRVSGTFGFWAGMIQSSCTQIWIIFLVHRFGYYLIAYSDLTTVWILSRATLQVAERFGLSVLIMIVKTGLRGRTGAKMIGQLLIIALTGLDS